MLLLIGLAILHRKLLSGNRGLGAGISLVLNCGARPTLFIPLLCRYDMTRACTEILWAINSTHNTFEDIWNVPTTSGGSQLPFFANQFPKRCFLWMRQSCAHEHSEFEFLSALVTVRCRGFVGSVSHLCQLLTLHCYHSRPDYPILGVTCWCLANWQPFLPSVCFFVAIASDFLSVLLNHFFLTGDDSICGGNLVHELWHPLRCSRGLHFSALLRMINCTGVRSALLSDVSDVIQQRCMLPHSAFLFPPFGQCVKVCGVIKGGHSCRFLASFHLIKASSGNVSAGWLVLCFPVASSQQDCRHACRVPHGQGVGTHLTCHPTNGKINFIFASVLLSFTTNLL